MLYCPPSTNMPFTALQNPSAGTPTTPSPHSRQSSTPSAITARRSPIQRRLSQASSDGTPFLRPRSGPYRLLQPRPLSSTSIHRRRHWLFKERPPRAPTNFLCVSLCVQLGDSGCISSFLRRTSCSAPQPATARSHGNYQWTLARLAMLMFVPKLPAPHRVLKLRTAKV